MTINVSSEYWAKLSQSGEVKLRAWVGSDDYTSRVLKWPKVKRTVESLRAATVTVPFANVDGSLNNFYQTAASVVTDLSLEMGFDIDSSFITDLCDSDNISDWSTTGVNSFYFDTDHYTYFGGDLATSNSIFQSFSTTSGDTYGLKVTARAYTIYASEVIDTDDQGYKVRDVFYTGDYLFVAADTIGLIAYTFDGSSLTHVVNSTAVNESCFGLWYDGEYIYLAAGAGGLLVYSFNGSAFTLLDSYDPGGQCRDVYGDGLYIYGAHGGEGLYAYSFDGSSLTVLASETSVTGDRGGYAHKSYIYSAKGTAGLYIYTFDGSSFTTVASWATSGTCYAAWSDGSFIYLADGGDGLQVFSFTGGALTLLDNTDPGGTCQGVWGDGTYIYLSAGEVGGLYMYTFDGSALTEVYNITPGDTAYRASGGKGFSYFFVANADNGVAAYDLLTAKNPDNFSFVYNSPSLIKIDGDDQGGSYFRLDGDDDFIYAAVGSEGIISYTFNGSTLTAISSVDGFDAFSIWQDGSNLYAGGDGIINKYSITSGELTYITVSSLGPSGSDALVRDIVGDNSSYIFAGQSQDGLRVYDTNLDLIAVSSGAALGVYTGSDYIYVARSSLGLRSYTFTGSDFIERDRIDIGGVTKGISRDANYIYTADDSAGINAFTVDSAGVFNHVGSAYPGEDVEGVWCQDGYVYAATGQGGVIQYNFDGVNFNLIAQNNEGTIYTNDVWGTSGYIYAANDLDGLVVYTAGYQGLSEILSVPVYDNYTTHKTTWTAIDTAISSYIGFAVGSGEQIDIDNIDIYTDLTEFDTVFKGPISAVKYSKTQCSIIAKDLIQGLTQYTIGESGAAVEYSGTIPTDIIWDLCTCYGGLDSTASTSNSDIDYTSFLELAGIYSADNVTLTTYFDGQKITSALDSVLTMTDARVYATGAGKLKFSRLEAATSADITLTPSDILDLGIDIDADEIINKSLTYYNYSVESSYFENYATYTNTDSQNSYGIYTYALADTKVWFTNANDADTMAARKAVLFGNPPVQYSVESTLLGRGAELTDTLRFVDSFFNVTSGTAWRVVEQTIDLNAGTVDNVLDSALTISAFYLDVNYLDSDARLL